MRDGKQPRARVVEPRVEARRVLQRPRERLADEVERDLGVAGPCAEVAQPLPEVTLVEDGERLRIGGRERQLSPLRRRTLVVTREPAMT